MKMNINRGNNINVDFFVQNLLSKSHFYFCETGTLRVPSSTKNTDIFPILAAPFTAPL